MPAPSKHALAVISAALLIYGLLIWRFDFLCDDAYISFRYARNAAEGNGLRFNLIVSGPVEGYSNFLWTGWLALVHRIGLDMRVVSRLTSALCGVLLVLWITRHAQRSIGLRGLKLGLPTLFAASLPPMALWATSGLEPMAVALLLFVAYDRLLGDPARPRGVQAGLALALAALVRADGMVFGAMLLGAVALLLPAAADRGRATRALLVAGGLVLAAVLAHMLWRYSTYGTWLPNTAKAKAGFSPHRLRRGFEYGVSYLLTFPAITLVLALSLRRWRPGRAHVWLPAGTLTLGTLAYSVYVGGDFMPMGRFLLPMLPFVALLLAERCSGWPSRRCAALGVALLGLNLMACFDVPLVPSVVQERFHFREDRPWESEVAKWRRMRRRNDERTAEAQALAQWVEPGESMIRGAIGAVGFYTRLEIYDLYGLVSPGVLEATQPLARSSPGHDRRVDEGYFLDRKPDYIGFHVVPAQTPIWQGLPRRLGGVKIRELIEVERHRLDDGRELHLLRLR